MSFSSFFCRSCSSGSVRSGALSHASRAVSAECTSSVMNSSWFAQWSVRPRARLLRSRAGCAPQRGVRSLLRGRPPYVLVRSYVQCWVPARLQPRARGDRLVHSGPPVQVVKEVVHVGQDGRSRHAWGSRSGWSARFSSRFLRGDVQVRSLAVSVVLSCSPGRSGRACAPCPSTRR